MPLTLGLVAAGFAAMGGLVAKLGATVGIVAKLRPIPTPITKNAGASAQRLTWVPA